MPPHGMGRVYLVALALVALIACGDDGSPTVETGQTPTTSPTSTVAPSPGGTGPATGNVVSVTVRGGQVEGASRQRVPVGQPVIVRVTSDVAEEVHVHGYDKSAPVAAGGTVDIRFDANIPGVFEVEFERSHRLLFTLEVR
ncbi:MAG TPA: hypothetical protein VHF27_10875 [Acidimicrobiales bacterium]|nr:hypothetical protein [Acidimicrobiales bacterium]